MSRIRPRSGSASRLSEAEIYKTPSQIFPKSPRNPKVPQDLGHIDSQHSYQLPTKSSLSRRKTICNGILEDKEIISKLASDFTSHYDNEIICWFQNLIGRRVIKTALHSTATLSAILIATSFLANITFHSPWYTFLNTLTPFLYPTIFLKMVAFSLLATCANSFVIAYFYKDGNIHPCSNSTTIFKGDLETLKIRMTGFFILSFLNATITLLLWNQPFNWEMMIILLFSTITTSTYTMLYKQNYCIAINTKEVEKELSLNLRQFYPDAVYRYVRSDFFKSYLQSALKMSVRQQALQFLIFWIFELILGWKNHSNSFSVNLDLLMFKFAFMILARQIHNYSRLSILERISFRFPEKYEISDRTIEQKVNMRAVLHTKDSFLKMFAFNDLSLLLEGDDIRKEAIYELSIPGNNPLNWNAIKSACLNELTAMISGIQGAREQLIGLQIACEAGDVEDVFNQSMLMMNPIQRLQMYSKSARRRHHVSLRKKPSLYAKPESEIGKMNVSPHSLATVQFAIKVLINILINSLACDRFGIVQQSNSAILRTVLQLAITIDKYTREKKQIITPDDEIDVCWLSELVNTINSSIYTFHKHFKDHIDSFGLSQEELNTYTQMFVKRFGTTELNF